MGGMGWGAGVTFEEYLNDRLAALMRSSAAICGDHHLGQELTQDVLVKLHRKWHELDGVDNIDAYIRRAVVNEYVSWRRKWARQQPFADLPESLLPDHAMLVSQRDQLRREVGRLPRRQRVALALRYFDDLSDQEIADAMGCTKSSVRSYISRGLAALRIEVRAAERMGAGIHED